MDQSPRVPNPDVTPIMKLWPDVGNLFGLGRSATYAAANRGEIPTLKIGGRAVVPTAALRRMFELDDGFTRLHRPSSLDS